MLGVIQPWKKFPWNFICLFFLQNDSTAVSELVNKDRDYLLEELKKLHKTLDSRQSDREALLQANRDLKDQIASLEEKITEWKAENLHQGESEELMAMTAAYEQAKNDCERLK